MPGLLLLAIALIVYGSLYPWDFHFERHAHPIQIILASWPHVWNRWAARDIAINVVLYFPLGVLAILAMRPRRQTRVLVLLAAVALGFALSASMEILQVFDDHREASLLDITTNTVGTIAGALFALALAPTLRSFASRTARRLDKSAVLLAALWAGFQFYPFFPFLSTYRLRTEIAALWHRFLVSPVPVWTGAAEWFALALLVAALVGSLPTRWLAVLMLLLFLRFFIATRTVGWNDFFAAGLALALWGAIPGARRQRAGLAIVLSSLLVYELAPFHWTAVPTEFSWIPFAATFDSTRGTAVVILMRKTFDCGAAVWLLHGAGWRYSRAGACVAAALFVLELVQRHLPGRTPEITDAVIAIIMAGALYLAGDSRKRPGLA